MHLLVGFVNLFYVLQNVMRHVAALLLAADHPGPGGTACATDAMDFFWLPWISRCHDIGYHPRTGQLSDPIKWRDSLLSVTVTIATAPHSPLMSGLCTA
jgi:hypothetical protein